VSTDAAGADPPTVRGVELGTNVRKAEKSSILPRDDGRHPFILTRETRKASIQLADELKSLVLAGGLKPGARLPSIDELVRQSGFSPATAREGLRILEREGLIEIRRGRDGGVFVRQPDYESIARSLRLLLRFHRDDPKAILEARREVEALCARLAAERISADDIAQLRASVTRHRQCPASEDAARENLFFHLTVVKAAQNRILEVLVEAVRSFVYDSTVSLFYSREKIAEAAEAHSKIVDALAAHNPGLAAKRMAKHLAAFEIYLVETRQVEALLDEPKVTPGGAAAAMTRWGEFPPIAGPRGAK
jgi:GntR family transcriptional repressor for pyruvate dehydrogenase complex